VDHPAVRIFLFDEKSDERGFTGARRTDEENELALLDVD
jgi:hypothetical protein